MTNHFGSEDRWCPTREVVQRLDFKKSSAGQIVTGYVEWRLTPASGDALTVAVVTREENRDTATAAVDVVLKSGHRDAPAPRGVDVAVRVFLDGEVGYESMHSCIGSAYVAAYRDCPPG